MGWTLGLTAWAGTPLQARHLLSEGGKAGNVQTWLHVSVRPQARTYAEHSRAGRGNFPELLRVAGSVTTQAIKMLRSCAVSGRVAIARMRNYVLTRGASLFWLCA